MSANLQCMLLELLLITNRAIDADRIQDYFAHHFGMSSLPKYICHLTWKGGDSPKLHHLAETAKNVSNIIKTAGMVGRIEPHQCSLFARSLLGVLATSFPGYVMEPPESVDEPLHYMYGLLYSWFDLGKPNDVALGVVQSVLSELSEYPRLQVSSWPMTHMDVRVASESPMGANTKPISTVLEQTSPALLRFGSV